MRYKDKIIAVISAMLMFAMTGCGISEYADGELSEVAKELEGVVNEGIEKVEEADIASTLESITEAVESDLEKIKQENIRPEDIKPEEALPGILASTADINLTNTDGKGSSYTFTYDGEDYSAVYTEDNWKIKNSYKITAMADMTIICQALIDEHPIHGSDMVSYRTADDMAYEWQMHNVAYYVSGDHETLRKKAKDVDFEPEDQNKSFDEIYSSHMGKDLSVDDLLRYLDTP